MDRFTGYVLPFTLKWEGGYVDDKDDPGGKTKYGITQATFELARKKGIVSKKDVSEIEKKDAEMIYRKLYWEPLGCDEMPLWVAVLVFDTAVNQGHKWGILHLQKTLTGIHRYVTVFRYVLEEDGVIGDKTLSALRDFTARAQSQAIDEFIRLYCVHRDLRYLEIVVNNPRLMKFAQGWFMRTSALQDYAQSLKDV